VADLQDFLLTKVVAPLAAGTVGVVTGAYRMHKALEERLKTLEVSWKQFIEHDYPREHLELHAANDSLKAELLERLRSLREELGAHDDRLLQQVEAHAKKHLEVQGLCAHHTVRGTTVETRLKGCEAAIEDLNEQFRSFAQGQNEQWQTMTRTLGQLEGYLQGIMKNPGSSKMFPPRP